MSLITHVIKDVECIKYDKVCRASFLLYPIL